MKQQIIFLGLVIALLNRGARGQTTQPAAGEFELHEWAVFVLDASQNKLNPDGLVSSTLPDFVEGRRQTASGELGPSPVCVIRLVGQTDAKVDVEVERADGSFLASWPRGQSRVKQLLWRNLLLSTQPGAGGLEHVPAEHWFTALRGGQGAYLSQQDGPSERFLLYDVEMPYTCPLEVQSEKDFSLEYKNTSKTILHDLTFYRPDDRGWRRVSVGDLAAAAPAATQPATRPALTARIKAQMSAGADDPLADWRQRLVSRGVGAADCDVILKMLAASALDSHRLTAVYVMDGAEYDRLLPLEVLPDPVKITRVAVVVVKNVDLAAGTEMDDLIAQLGDPVWARRVAAYDALAKLGKAALPKLQEAMQNKDVEIVWRAERLITQAQKPQQGAQP